MSDIGERLKRHGPAADECHCWSLTQEAGAEIARLSAEAVLHDKQDGDNAREISRLNAHITKQDTEIERLKAALEHHKGNSLNAMRIVGENERLKAALRALRRQALQSDVNDPANEWGREALEQARAALEAKP